MFARLTPMADSAAPTSQVELSAAIIVAVIVIVIARQFQARRVRPLSYLLVAVLVAVGFQPPGPAEKTAEGIGVLVFGLVISAIFGVVRGFTIPAWTDERGRTWTKGNRTTLWLWIATILTRLVVGGLAAVAFHQPINVGALWLGFATTLGAQLIVVRLRPLTPTRVPAVRR